MNLSHAMAVAADDMGVKDERLRAIAQTLESEQRGPARRPRPPATAANLEGAADWREGSVLALQASRRLLARSIDMLT
jgi:hypothetical protein